MTLPNPLLFVREHAKRRHAPVSIKNGSVLFPLREGQGASCMLTKPSYTLCFAMVAGDCPLPRGEVVQFFSGINRLLAARGHFHAEREGKFSLHPEKRLPRYDAHLPDARKRTQQEVDEFLRLMEAQFMEVYPLFYLAHHSKQFPGPALVELTLAQTGPWLQ